MLVATLAAVALALVARDVHVLDGVEDETVAMRFEARGTQPADDVAVVAIDDVTFSDLEVQWPFKRSLHARAIDALRRAGAKQIVYDVQFTEPTTEREDQALFRAVRRAGDVVLATTETDGSGGTNVLGGEENLEQRRRARRRREPRDRPRRRHPPLPLRLRRPAQRRRRRRRPRRRARRSRRAPSTATARGSTTPARAGPCRPRRSPTSSPAGPTRSASAAASSSSARPPRRSRTSTRPRPPTTA